MELPHVGEHCSEVTCRQLDFLPFTCSLCKEIYCSQHQSLTAHNCRKAGTIDVQVPVCPLCDQAVPAPRGQAPDIAISQHLDDNCRVKNEKIFKNKCCYARCRKKELMPIQCQDCGLNFCIPHRHPNDHQCRKVHLNGQTNSNNPSSSGTFLQSLRDQAAFRLGLSKSSSSSSPSNTRVRSSSSNSTWEQRQRTDGAGVGNGVPTNRGRPANTTRDTVTNLQGSMSEDEALALALSQSEQESSRPEASAARDNNTPDGEDAMLQRAIAASLSSNATQHRTNASCHLM